MQNFHKAANICNILPRQAVANRLIVVKLKRDRKCRGHAYFKPVHPHFIYHALDYLKYHNKIYADIYIAKHPSSEEMFRFLKLLKFKKKQSISDGTGISENVNDTENEYALVKDLLSLPIANQIKQLFFLKF